jgi:hypothetical protein
MKTIRWLQPVLLVAGALVLVGCLAGPNEHLGTENAVGDVAGFWRGLWHGMIFPLSFLISLFTDAVQVYEVHNNGGWYNFGYLLGLGLCFGGPGHGSGRAWRQRK